MDMNSINDVSCYYYLDQLLVLVIGVLAVHFIRPIFGANKPKTRVRNMMMHAGEFVICFIFHANIDDF